MDNDIINNSLFLYFSFFIYGFRYKYEHKKTKCESLIQIKHTTILFFRKKSLHTKTTNVLFIMNMYPV